MNSYDIFAISHELIDALENRIYDRCINHQHLPQQLFKIDDVHVVEKYLRQAYDAGMKCKKPEA
ncbi:MAG: hypothetical protein K0U12_01895 [Gammaproteobacteria bacterium]|nr:hypothetical protein [Gammaproteobacteria bacterium]